MCGVRNEYMAEDMSSAISLLIGGITPFSTVDWPGKLSCVCFLVGCPFRCPYCQNFQFWNKESYEYTFEDVYNLLLQRQGLLDGVVFSGGEPLQYDGVIDAMRCVKELGFEVGLHTAGPYPNRFKQALKYLDWVGLDVKATKDKYDFVTRSTNSFEKVDETLDLLLASDCDYEIRTTWHPDLLSAQDIRQIALYLKDKGVDNWVIQAYRPIGVTGELDNRTVRSSDVPDCCWDMFDTFEFRGDE